MVNQCLETYLRCFVHAYPNKWSSWLSLIELWYNTSFCSALGQTPFFVLYGHEPHHLGINAPSASDSSDLKKNTWLQDKDHWFTNISFVLNIRWSCRQIRNVHFAAFKLVILFMSRSSHMSKHHWPIDLPTNSPLSSLALSWSLTRLEKWPTSFNSLLTATFT